MSSGDSGNKRQKTSAIEVMADAVRALAQSSTVDSNSQKRKEQLDFIDMLTKLELQVSNLYTELENCKNEQRKTNIEQSIQYYEARIQNLREKVHSL